MAVVYERLRSKIRNKLKKYAYKMHVHLTTACTTGGGFEPSSGYESVSWTRNRKALRIMEMQERFASSNWRNRTGQHRISRWSALECRLKCQPEAAVPVSGGFLSYRMKTGGIEISLRKQI